MGIVLISLGDAMNGLLDESSTEIVQFRRIQEFSLMITSIHTLIYSDDAPATRAFLRDVLGWPYVEDAAGRRRGLADLQDRAE